MKKLLAALFLSFILISLPGSAHAANATFFGPIVPAECHCDSQANVDNGAKDFTTAPDYGCALQVIQNVINFAVSMGVILFVLYLTYAGFILVTSGGSPGAREQGKTRLMNVVIGMTVLLCSWLIVDFVMKTLYSNDVHFGPWNAILAGKTDGSDRCIVAKKPTGLTSGSLSLIFGSPSPGTSSGGVSGESGNTKMNSGTAASYATSHARSSSGGQCALYVRQALAAGGLTQFNNDHPASAYQYGPYLTKAGFTQIAQGTYNQGAEGLSGLQAGDVVVFGKVAGHPDGHIAIYNGSQWVSDYKQSTMSSNPKDYAGGTYTIYRP